MGQIWTHSVYIRRVAGTLTGISHISSFLTEWSAGPTFLGQQAATIDVSSATMPASRQVFSATLAQPTTTLVGSQLSFNPLIGVAIDCTFRIAAPQLEQKDFATSVILNPAGFPAATTRNAENASRAFSIASEFSIFSEIVHASITSIASGVQTLNQFFVSKDDGSTVAVLRTFKDAANNF